MCEHMFVSVRSPHVAALARAIRQLRRERRLSQEALADAAGIHPKHLSELERANKEPRATTLARLAQALGISPAELYERAFRPPPGASAGRDR